jgi:Protein of unknown function (DUF1703)./Predicted AAA-ATPase.
MLQPISNNTSDFPKMRKRGFVYVDKTAYLYKMITGDDDCLFLARPRRFGKSLMISTLKAIFQGRRELFDGLAISKMDWKWEEYPVLHFNFGFAAMPSAEEFHSAFENTVEATIVAAGGKYDENKTAAANFGNAIDSLAIASNGKGVVILIDEYDDPVAQLLHKKEDAEKVRDELAGFYHQMKDRTGNIRFLMITGVSKFTKISVFSALANLTNISMSDEYATMLGYTEQELDKYFDGHLHAHADKMGVPYDEYRSELKRWFNGYRFGKYSDETVFNPVSIGVNLSKREPAFIASWTETGKSSMLMNFINREDFLSIDMDAIQDVDESEFDVSDIRNLRAIPMLFQTGYLTIANYDMATRTFNLTVPDEEVRQDLATLTLAVATDFGDNWVVSLGKKLLKAKWNEFFTGLKSLYAALPYGPKEGDVQEFSFERCLYVLLKSQAIRCKSEDRQANGQADIVAISAVGVFIFELKVDESADEALKQVKDKHYDAPYQGRNLPIWLIGLNFDRKTRHLLDAKVERV